MTIEIAVLFGLVVVMVLLFMSEKLPLELTAFLGLLTLVLVGFLGPEEAFAGFSSPAVITMLSIFIVGTALRITGVADLAGSRIHALVGNREVPLILTIMAASGLVSAFMNNIAATAVLMPTVGSIVRRSGLSPSRLYMPLALGAVLGGALTLVGTPPNILSAEVLVGQGLEPFSLFDFTPLGALMVLAGMLFMVTLGRRLLPARFLSADGSQARELAQVYKLEEQLFSIRIPPNSRLDGLTLGQSRLGTALDVQVLAITRKGKKMLAPEAETVLRSGDVLVVEGRLKDLQELFRLQGVEVRKVESGELPRPVKGVTGIRLRIPPDSRIGGRTLRALRFRERFGAVVVGIRRGDDLLRDRLSYRKLLPGDVILAVGERDQLDALAKESDLEVERSGLSSVQQLHEQLYLLRIPEGSPLAGATLASSRLGELTDVTIGGLIRGGATRLGVPPEEILQAEDRLLVVGEPARIMNLLELVDVQLESEVSEPSLESEEVGIVEAIVAPRSGLAGRTLAEISFRDRFGLQVLAIWREGRPYRTRLADFSMQVGDALLLQGPWEKIRLLVDNADFLLLSQALQAPRRTERAPVAVLGLGLLIALTVSGLQPAHIAAFAAAVFVLLTRALTMDEAYRNIDWRAIFLVAAILPLGTALEQTGGAELLARTVSDVAGHFGPLATLGTMTVLSSLLSQALDGAPAVVLLGPVAVQSALQMGISPYPLVMGVALGASIVFLTPFSGKATLLVMGAGGYRAVDYFKVGAPLTLLLLILVILAIPRFFPF